MKNIYSLITFLLILIISLGIGLSPISKLRHNQPFCLTTYDALGYYMYLPAIFIYEDVKQMAWLSEIDAKYAVTGGSTYQIIKEKNGNYVCKYQGGVALMQMPFFAFAHILTKLTDGLSDGFSSIYQYAVFIAAFFYAFLGLFYLRKFLLYYFEDNTVTLTLISLTLASNWLQYVAIDCGMSHAYIFFLYVFILWFTKKWHENPSQRTAFAIGVIIGLATISRPTEAIMIFIPLLWDMQTKETSNLKWIKVKNNLSHLGIAILGGLLAISPQLAYWQYTSGQLIYDVGSKWVFLNPYFRVLFGFEKGWFIYTPVTILYILGLFFLQKYPFKKSVTAFCLLNIYIIIAWSDWHYGASYSCRALVQSYAIFALPLAAIIHKIMQIRWRIGFYILIIYLTGANLFQIYQYNTGILLYDENSFEYYKSIYLNPNAKPFEYPTNQ